MRSSFRIRFFPLLLLLEVTSRTFGQFFLLNPNLLKEKLDSLALSKDGLGLQEMQNYLNELQFNEESFDGKSTIQLLADKLSQKFEDRFNAVKNLKSAVESSYSSPESLANTECCHVGRTSLKYDSRFRQDVKTTDFCTRKADSSTISPRELNSNVKKAMENNFIAIPYLKWQYFGSDEGLTTIYPYHTVSSTDCGSYDNRYRPWYVSTATPEPKNVVIVIDISGSMGAYFGEQTKLELAVEAAGTILDTLNPRDKVGVVAFSSAAKTPGSLGTSQCYDQYLAQATPVNVAYLKKFLSGLESGGFTMYSYALSSAFQMLRNSKPSADEPDRKQVILFMSGGKPTDLKGTIMKGIVDSNTLLDNNVIIMTYGIGGDNFDFLENIAKQEGFGYKWNATAGEVTAGQFIQITDVKKLRNEMATYYDFFSEAGQATQPIIAVPYFDAWGLGLITTVSLPCYHNNKFIGVVGIDITMSDLVADVTYFGPGKQSYAFVIDASGLALMHPLLQTPLNVHDDTQLINIKHLEPEVASEIFASMRRGGSGNSTFVTKSFSPRGGGVPSGVKVQDVNATYYWSPVPGTNFSVGLVVVHEDNILKLKSLTPHSDFKFVYHRLDLKPVQEACSQFQRYATRDVSIVKFSAEAFTDPYMYIGLPETPQIVEKYTEYMTDKTNTVVNPGFRDGVKDAIIASHMVEDIWLNHKTELTKYVIWRYLGSSRGTMRLYPGVLLPTNYDPTKRPWYHGAVDNAGRTTLSTPYIDAFGAGVVITLAHTLSEGNNTDIFGAMGADFTLRYFNRLITDTYPTCKGVKYTCFIMDSSGFLVMHDDFTSPDITAATLENVHITTKHSLVAQDMIAKGILVGHQCSNFAELGSQLFYEVHLKTTQRYILSTGGCQKYEVCPIGDSNIYLGIIEGIRDACVPPPCDCPIDKKCSTSPTSCKCPCSTTLTYDYCANDFPTSSIPVCPVPPAIIAALHMTENVHGIEKCYDPKCDLRSTFGDCYGVVGCSWCVMDGKGVAFTNPYCVDQNLCYGGQLGKTVPGSPTDEPETPWHEEISNIVNQLIESAPYLFGVVALVSILAFCRRKKRQMQRQREQNARMELHQSPQHPAGIPPSGEYGQSFPVTQYSSSVTQDQLPPPPGYAPPIYESFPQGIYGNPPPPPTGNYDTSSEPRY